MPSTAAVSTRQAATGQSPPAPAWLTVEQASRILAAPVRTIRHWCATGQIQAVREGAGWLIDPAARPELQVATGSVTALAPAGSAMAGVPAAHREAALSRLELVEAYESWRESAPAAQTAAATMARFCVAWSAQPGHAPISPITLRRMIARYRRGGLAGLVDRRCRNGRDASFDTEAQAMLLGLYLSENRPALPQIYELVEAEARRRGWSLPGLRAVRAWLARRDPKILAAGCDPKRYRDRCTPTIERDWTLVPALGCVVGDHHQFDLFWPRLVWNHAKGCCEWRWYRPWLTAWLDARTWYPYGACLAFDSPDGDRVMGSFLAAAMEHGLPDHVYLDNGKDFKMRRFAGGRSRAAAADARIVAQRHVAPVLQCLGVEATFALRFNARAKVIEPWFKLVEQRFGKQFGTYCGNKPERRPERLKALAGKAGQYAAQLLDDDSLRRLDVLDASGDQGLRDDICLAPLRALLLRWLRDDYCRRQSPARAAGARTCEQAFHELRAADHVERRPPEGDLALLLMPSQAVSVRANGVWVGRLGTYYWADELEPIRCQPRARVIARFNPDDPSRVYVFDLADRFICAAAPYIGSGLHPLAAGEADRARVSDAIALQRRTARDAREQVAALRTYAAQVLIESHIAAGIETGRIARHELAGDPPRLPAGRHGLPREAPRLTVLTNVSEAASEREGPPIAEQPTGLDAGQQSSLDLLMGGMEAARLPTGAEASDGDGT